MTREERKDLLKQIAEVGGGSDILLTLLKNIDEDMENAEQQVETIPDGFKSWSDALTHARAETDAANKRYIERFFKGVTPVEKIPEEDPENKRRDYAELFETKSKEEK